MTRKRDDRTMVGWLLGIGGAVLSGATAAVGARAYRHFIRDARDDHSRRPALWQRFYAIDWGETATNNYGFAPAPGTHPERFQHQIYRELLRRLQAKRPLEPHLRLVEVSCGRGGGLNAFLAAAPGAFDATGIDVADSAIDFCRRTYGESERLHFIQASALHLPFPDGSVDVILNVEASNDYGDRAAFFAEVARVLKSGGIFLYTDTFRAGRAAEMKQQLKAAGFEARIDDITPNVVEACRLDTPRRREVLDRHAPLLGRLFLRRRLENYAAVEGSKKFRAFAERRRTYLMTAAVKT